METKYNKTKLIEELKEILQNNGNLSIFIQGQDSGGIYPNDYVKHKLAISYLDNSTICITIDFDKFSEAPSTVEEFIEMLESSTLYGNSSVLIEYMDSGGSYSEFGSLFSVDVKEVEGEQRVILC